jgi:hypothetical protein
MSNRATEGVLVQCEPLRRLIALLARRTATRPDVMQVRTLGQIAALASSMEANGADADAAAFRALALWAHYVAAEYTRARARLMSEDRPCTEHAEVIALAADVESAARQHTQTTSSAAVCS